jgi:hypothetical protein
MVSLSALLKERTGSLGGRSFPSVIVGGCLGACSPYAFLAYALSILHLLTPSGIETDAPS